MAVRYIEYERIKIFEERRGERERDIGCCEQALEPKFITNGEGGGVGTVEIHFFISLLHRAKENRSTNS